ncbi:MAG: DUF1499 domain-containing protein [Hyphomicrobiales bacterium]
MSRIKKILWAALGVTVVVPIAIFFHSPESFWQRLAGSPDLGPTNFARLTKSPKPNQHLICPPSVCTLEPSDQKAKNYQVDAVTLKLRFIATIGTDNIEIVENSDNVLRFIVRTPFFKFPDTVSVAFFPTDNGSTFALYSRSQLGYFDLDTNRLRAQKWLAELDKLISQETDRNK